MELEAGEEIAVPKDNVMSSINFSAMAGSYNQNVSVFPVKDNSIVSNLESIREMNVGSQPFCKGERVRAIEIELYLFNNSSLDIFGKFQEFFFSKFCKVVANRASPAFFLTSLPETMPDLRDFSSEARNSGLDASNSSPSSSSVCLSNTNPNVSPFLLTTRTTLCKGNKSLNVLEFSKRTIFSFNKGITIFLPPFDFLKKVYHSYGNLSSMAYEAAGTISGIFANLGSSNQSYNVVVRVLVPQDFGTWDSSAAIAYNTNIDATPGNSGVTLAVYDTTAPATAAYTGSKITTNGWAVNNVTAANIAGTYTGGTFGKPK